MGKLKRILSLIAFVAVMHSVSAQEKNINLEIGYGLTVITESIDHKFGRDHAPSGLIGVNYSSKYPDSKLRWTTGLNVLTRSQGRVTYLNLPLGIEYHFGNKLRFITGIGGYPSLLIAYKNPDQQDEYKTVHAGAYVKAATSYRLSEKYSIMAGWRANMDLTRMYTNRYTGFTGSYHHDNYKGYDFLFVLGVIYDLD